MRHIVLAASLLATLSAPAFAHGRHHATMPARASGFVDLAPAGVPAADVNTTHANTPGHRCVWTAVCSY